MQPGRTGWPGDEGDGVVTGRTLDQQTRVLARTFAARLQDVQQHFVGRDEVVELLGLAVLCREHVLLIGPPGTAKSSMLDRFCSMLGARYFTYLLTRFTEPAELFGPLDVKVFQQESRYQVNSAGMLPEVEVAFLDEIFQGSSAILNTLLSLVNERKFHNGSQVVDTPLMTMMGSANEIPDEPVLAAFSDRFLLRHRIDYVPEDDLDDLIDLGWATEQDLIRAAQRAGSNGADPDRGLVEFGLDNLARLQQSVATVDLLPVRAMFAEIVRSFRAEGVAFSDRRIVKAQKMFAAAALLRGRAEAEPADLAVLTSMWVSPQDAETVQRIITDQGIPLGGGPGGPRVSAEIRIELQELAARSDAATSGPELRETLRRLQRINLEVRRDHGNDGALQQRVAAQLRDGLTRYQERFGQERLEDV
jgi:MoxR-like ATPase